MVTTMIFNFKKKKILSPGILDSSSTNRTYLIKITVSLKKSSSKQPKHVSQGRGFLCVTRLDCNGHFLRFFKSYQTAYLLSTLEHLLFPFIVQQNLNPTSGFMGFKASHYWDSIREMSFLLDAGKKPAGEPFMTSCLELKSQRRFVLLQSTRC